MKAYVEHVLLQAGHILRTETEEGQEAELGVRVDKDVEDLALLARATAQQWPVTDHLVDRVDQWRLATGVEHS